MPKVENGLQSSAIGDPNKKWVDAKIPYVIANDYSKKFLTTVFYTSFFHNTIVSFNIFETAGEQRRLIIRAMNSFQENTCIRFVDRSNELDYITIQKTGEGYE